MRVTRFASPTADFWHHAEAQLDDIHAEEAGCANLRLQVWGQRRAPEWDGVRGLKAPCTDAGPGGWGRSRQAAACPAMEARQKSVDMHRISLAIGVVLSLVAQGGCSARAADALVLNLPLACTLGE